MSRLKKTAGEIRKQFGVPDDFFVQSFDGVAVSDLSKRQLIALVDSSVYEATILRKKVEAAIEKGEELNAAAENKTDAQTTEVEQKEEAPQ